MPINSRAGPTSLFWLPLFASLFSVYFPPCYKAKVVTYLGSLAQLCCGEGGKLQTNITGICGDCLQCMDHTGFVPAHSGLCFPSLGCSAEVLSKAGPVFRAFPRSKLLRFRFLGMPQRHRIGWVCVLCPSQVQTAQVTRCLASARSQVGHGS